MKIDYKYYTSEIKRIKKDLRSYTINSQGWCRGMKELHEVQTKLARELLKRVEHLENELAEAILLGNGR